MPTGCSNLSFVAIETTNVIGAGKNPMGMAVSLIYLSTLINGIRINQEEFATESGITVVTVRRNARIIKDKLGIKFDKPIHGNPLERKKH